MNSDEVVDFLRKGVFVVGLTRNKYFFVVKRKET